MAQQSKTHRVDNCRYCTQLINEGEYVAWTKQGYYAGRKWHLNCENPNLNPDTNGFPSRKAGEYCAAGYANCVKPAGTRTINRGDMIKAIGANLFSHIECVPGYRASPTPSNNGNAPELPTIDYDIADTDNAAADNDSDSPAPPVAQYKPVAPPPANNNNADGAMLREIVAALTDFIAKQNKTTGELKQAIEWLNSATKILADRATASDSTIAGLAEQLLTMQTTIADLQERRPITIIIPGDNDSESVTRDMGYQHRNFSLLLRQCKLRDNKGHHINILMAGPAGSGKSTAGEKIAEAMGLDFEVQGTVLTQYELMGYRSPSTNELMETAFYRAYAFGKVLLADEMDAWGPGALLKINGAIANGLCDFPQGLVKRHPNFIMLGAANTWGHGGDSNYVGRNKLDATTKDRFLKISWPYDEVHERHIVGATGDITLDAATDHWVAMVQRARTAVYALGAFIVFSPRASLNGAMMIRAADFTREEIVSSVFGDLRDPKVCPAWATIGREIEEWAKQGDANDTEVNNNAIAA